MVTLADIQAALARIRDSIILTPFGASAAFSQSTGNTVFLKLENHQVTGAYKERCAVKETKPNTRVIGVQTSRLPSMRVAVAENGPVLLPAASTIADGIAVRCAGSLTLPMVKKYVDDIVTVDEEEIANAILLLLEREKTLAEGAGAAAIAALLNHKLPLAGNRVAEQAVGGKLDVTLLAPILERALLTE